MALAAGQVKRGWTAVAVAAQVELGLSCRRPPGRVQAHAFQTIDLEPYLPARCHPASRGAADARCSLGGRPPASATTRSSVGLQRPPCPPS